MQPAPADRLRLRGRHVILVLAMAVLATAVVPPLAAWQLNHARIERAAATAQQIAAHLRAHGAPAPAVRDAVVCGPGRLPRAADSGRGWLASPAASVDLFGVTRPTDPWGRCFLVNLSALARGEPVLVISAGPNALVDTPLGAPGAARDDVAVRVW